MIFMTARVATANGAEIKSEPGESPSEVISTYVRELRARGHDITRTNRCRNCHQEFRWYYPLHQQGVTIYSDFAEGEQCEHRQMNVHAPDPAS